MNCGWVMAMPLACSHEFRSALCGFATACSAQATHSFVFARYHLNRQEVYNNMDSGTAHMRLAEQWEMENKLDDAVRALLWRVLACMSVRLFCRRVVQS